MYVGVDCGTQSTKVIVVDRENCAVLGEGSAGHELISGDNGRREQQPRWWLEAFEAAFAQAIRAAAINPREIQAIGVSGQQHSMVALDKNGAPVYPAKLWCDTETAPESEALIEQLGGQARCLDTLGVVPQAAFTVTKIAWLRAHHPEAYRAIDTVLLPHDYLNYYLTDNRVAECGDASGTGYLDTRSRGWHPATLAAAAPELDHERVLPTLLEPDAPAGVVRAEIAQRLNLADDVLVSAGGGDNMMAAIGIGNLGSDRMTMSLGTSGTVFAHSDRPVVADDGLINNFCASHGGWLPLVCTLNLTSVTARLQDVLGLDQNAFTDRVAAAAIGSDGITVLPFFNGERVPALPQATASFNGLTERNFTAANLCRSVVEGTTFGLRYGMELFAANGVEPAQIRLVGGGAKSRVWRQIVADITGVEIVCPAVSEAAALGGALQAQWCHRNHNRDSVTLAELCAHAVAIAPDAYSSPDPDSVARYNDAYAAYRAEIDRRYPG